MDSKKVLMNFLTIFVLAFVVNFVVLFLWNIIFHGQVILYWEISFQFAFIIGIILTWMKEMK